MIFTEDDDDRDPEEWNPGPGDRSATKRRRPLVILSAILGVFLLLFELGSFFFGGYQFATVEWDPRTFGGFTGITFGSKVFYAASGASVGVHYLLDVRRGTFAIWIKKLEPGMTGPVLRRTNFSQSATGDFTVPISQSGFYMIHLDGTPITGAYEIAHRISWRIH